MLLLVFNIQAQNQNTTFNDLVGYTVDSTGIITKTGGDGWNNSMATSNQEIVANDIGSVTYVVQTENDKMALGLSTASTELKVSSINYRMMIDKKLALWEGKKNKGNYGNLVIGDVLEIARVATGKIQFKKNGNILLEIPTDMNQVLYVKFVLQGIGQTLPARSIVGDFYEEMQISSTTNHETCLIGNIGAIDITVAKGFPPFTYSWSNGASIEDLTSLTTGDYIVTVTDAASKQQTKTIKVQKEVVWVDSQATTSLSKNRLLTNTDGNVSYQVDQEGFTKSFGLEEQKEEHVPDVIDYSIKLTNNGLIEIFWQGTQLLGDFGTYTLGDVLKVEKLGDQIIYKKNETTITTGTIEVTKKMVARYILFTTGATFNNVNTDFCNIPLEVTYTTTLVSQNQLGGIQVFPMYGTPPYTYVWLDGETTQNRIDLESAVYRLMVTDAGLIPDRVKVTIPVGMELEFTELQGVDVVNNEGLVKTAPEDSYGNAMATLNNVVEGDGEVRMEISKIDQEFVVGFRNIDNPQATIYQELAYGFVIDHSNFSAWDNEELTPLGTIEVGDVLSIEKINATIYYKKNEEVLREIQIKQKGIVKSIDLASNTTIITRVCNGEDVTCTRSLETGIVEGSAVVFDINKTDSLIEEIVAVKALQEQSTTLTPIDKVSECVKSEANQSQFKIDFSLKTLQANITKISVIKFTAYPRIKGVVQHLDCNDLTVIASIETQIISGTPPYLYNWTGPNNQIFDTQNISVNESGLYTLNVTDSWINPHTASKTFEVGYQAKLCHVEGAAIEPPKVLQEVQKESSSLVREKSAEGTCGRATSLNRLNPNDNGSITYIVDQMGYSKGFGLTTSSDLTNEPATADISSTSETLISEVSYGILLKPDGTINIRENELSVGDFGTFKIGDVLKVIREGNQIVYQHNDNVLKTTATDPSLMLVARYLLIDNCATFNNIYTDFCNLGLNVDYIATNESITSLGTIQLFPKGGVPPYYFFWEDGNRSKNRYNLVSGIYNVSIIDTTFLDTIKLSIPINVEIEFSNTVGLELIKGGITKTAADGWGTGLTTLKNIVNGDGQIGIELVEFGLRIGTREFTYGLRNINNTQASTYQEMDYAFYVDATNQLFAWDNGQLTNLGTTNGGDILTIKNEGNTVVFQQNGTTLRQADFNSTNIYLVDISMYSSGMKVAGVIVGGHTIVPNVSATITHAKSCGVVGGAIDLIVKGGVPPYTYAWSNGATIQDVTELAPGIYTVTITQGSPFLQAITKTYEIGYEVIWTDLTDAVANGNSISSTSSTTIESSALSTNRISGNQSGWVEFTIPVLPFTDFIDYPFGSLTEIVNGGILFIESTDTDYNTGVGDYISHSWFYADRYIHHASNPNYSSVLSTNDMYLAQYFIYFSEPFVNTDRFRIEWIPNLSDPNNSTINYYKNGILRAFSVNEPINTSKDFNLFVLLDNNSDWLTERSSLINVVTSFGCPSINPAYYQQATLKKKLDGGFYVADNGNLLFQYQELYKEGVLNYKIYNSIGTVVLDGAQLPQTKKFGLNKYQLNLNYRSEFIPEEFYVLEVINDKNQSEFLRFKF